jgi:N-acetylmuramoyl-L-alanine amidase CwlA
MTFALRYPIRSALLTKPSRRRSGQLLTQAVRFIVAHDTGNPSSTANNNVRYYERTRNEIAASAHIFVDDREIVECIPALASAPAEKAWHVLYAKPVDNKLFGVDANDAAIGIEYCYGAKIDAAEAYARYVWVIAYACFVFGLDPTHAIVGHYTLDPERKTDPVTGLADSDRTMEQLQRDAVTCFVECGGTLPTSPAAPSVDLPIA